MSTGPRAGPRRAMGTPAKIAVLSLGIWAAAGLVGVGSSIVSSGPRQGDGRGSSRLPVLALLFAFAEIFVVHLRIRADAHTFSLVELPLALGLFFVRAPRPHRCPTPRRRTRPRLAPQARSTEAAVQRRRVRVDDDRRHCAVPLDGRRTFVVEPTRLATRWGRAARRGTDLGDPRVRGHLDLDRLVADGRPAIRRRLRHGRGDLHDQPWHHRRRGARCSAWHRLAAGRSDGGHIPGQLGVHDAAPPS